MRLLILILLAAPLLAQNKTGGALSQPVTNIMNRPITTGVPFMGQVLSFDGTKWVYWTPQTVPTLTSQLTNNSGFLTSVPAQSWASITGKPTLISYWTNDAGYLTSASSITLSQLPLGNFSTRITSGTYSISISGVAASATAVAWTGVTGRPTALSFFTNDSGYLTAVPAQTWASITGKPTAVSAWTNDAGYLTAVPAQTWASVTGKPTAVSAWTNDSGYLTSASSLAWANVTGAPAFLTSVPAQTWASITGKPTVVSTWTNDAGYLTSVPAQTWASITGKPTAVSAWTNDVGYTTMASLIAMTWSGGDLTGSVAATTVAKIQGQAVLATAPTTGQVLTWGGSSWGGAGVPAQTWASITGKPTAVSAWTNDAGYITAVPAQTWVSITGKPTGISTWTNDSGYLTAATLAANAGDVTGAQTASTVVKVQGQAVSSTAPTTGQVFTWSGTQWAGAAIPAQSWASITGKPTAVSAFTNDAGYLTSGTLSAAGGDLSGTLANATVTHLQNNVVSSNGPALNQALTWNGSQWAPMTTTWAMITGKPTNISTWTNDSGYLIATSTLTGDVTGAMNANTVAHIQNRTVAATAPSQNQSLVWNANTTQWEPTSVSPLWFVDHIVMRFGNPMPGLIDWGANSGTATAYPGGGIQLTNTGDIDPATTTYRIDVANMDSFFVHKGSFPSSTLIMGFGKATPHTTTTNDVAIRRNADGTFTAICLGTTATIVAGSQPGTVFRIRRRASGNYLYSVNGGVETSMTCAVGTTVYLPFYNTVHTGTSSFIFKMFAINIDDWFGGLN
jgi:hypothetical protein